MNDIVTNPFFIVIVVCSGLLVIMLFWAHASSEQGKQDLEKKWLEQEACFWIGGGVVVVQKYQLHLYPKQKKLIYAKGFNAVTACFGDVLDVTMHVDASSSKQYSAYINVMMASGDSVKLLCKNANDAFSLGGSLRDQFELIFPTLKLTTKEA
ncbi:hypothetical protein [Neptuniibacter sp. QD37_11]|uniref:hypothetical protein n=1 Tax=Neptuniibacter sp. QD37_11 TaxID=3398209 RepID=UPI0039F63E4D